MWTLRKTLMAGICVFALLFLLRSIGTPSSSLPDSSYAHSSFPGSVAPHRSYPPPKKPPQTPQDQATLGNSQAKSLRERLQYQYPYDLESKFPAYIWQTWKVNPASGEFPENLREMEASWSEMHPGFVHEVVTDEAALHLISYLYASVPEVFEAYEALPIPVLKADFFRYLILLARGGIYSDIDTEALRSAVDWLPEDFDRSTVGLVVGIEADPDRPDWAKWYSRRIQFCQWTLQAKPGHPVLRDVVAIITEETLRMKREKLLRKGRAPKSIVEFTGPAMWTDALFAYFNNPSYFDYSKGHANITWTEFTGITERKKVGDVIVLPITSFSPGVRQMGAEGLDHPMAFVKHEFEGTWKPASERVKPIVQQ